VSDFLLAYDNDKNVINFYETAKTVVIICIEFFKNTKVLWAKMASFKGMDP